MSESSLTQRGNKFYNYLGRLFSATIWVIVCYLSIPRLINISYFFSFFLAILIGAGILLIDTAILKSSHKNENTFEYKFILFVRTFISGVMSWVGGFAITINLFWSVYQNFNKQYTGNYIQVFMRMVENNRSVFVSLLVITICLFIMDYVGRLFNRLLAEKEDTIQIQLSEIIQKDVQLEQSYKAQLDIISSIQHELGNKLPIAKNTLSDLMNSLKRVEGFNLEQKIRSKLPGESEVAIDTYGDLLKRLETNLFYSISIVDNIRGVLKADPSRFQPELLSLRQFLTDEVPKHIDGIEGLKWEVTGIDTILSFDPSQMSVLLSNLIDNARRHGFSQLQNEQPLLECSISETDNNTILKIKNNGAPLRHNFTLKKFITPGERVGPTGHSGLGGYLIHMVTVNHNANIEIQNSESPFSVEVSITF